MRGTALRFSLTLAVIGAVALSAWSMRFFGRYQPLADLTAGSGGLGTIGLEIQNSQVTGRLDGKKRWQIAARMITFSRDQREVSADGIHSGRLYAPSGKPLATLQAGGVTYQSPVPIFNTGPQGFLQVTGGIKAHLLRAFGPTLTAAGLTWNPAANLVQSQGSVAAEFPAHTGTLIGGARLAADSVQWNTQADQLQDAGHVHVVFANNVGDTDGMNAAVDLHTGNLTLHSLTGTFHPAPEVTTAMSTHSSRPLLALAGFSLAAAAAAAPTAPPDPVNYKSGSILTLNQQGQALLGNGVTIQQGDENLQTDAATVHFDDQQHITDAASRAPVHLWDTQDDITGQHGTIDFRTHVATVQTNVVVVVKPGPSDKSAPKTSLHSHFDAPATMTCQLMTYNYHTKIGTVPGPLTVHQKDRLLTADSGTYNARTQIVMLVGHVHGHNNNNVVDAPEAEIGIRAGEEFLKIDKPTSGVFQPNQSDEADDGADTNQPVDDKAGYEAEMNGGLPPVDNTTSDSAAPQTPGTNAPATPPAPAAPASPDTTTPAPPKNSPGAASP